MIRISTNRQSRRVNTTSSRLAVQDRSRATLLSRIADRGDADELLFAFMDVAPDDEGVTYDLVRYGIYSAVLAVTSTEVTDDWLDVVRDLPEIIADQARCDALASRFDNTDEYAPYRTQLFTISGSNLAANICADMIDTLEFLV